MNNDDPKKNKKRLVIILAIILGVTVLLFSLLGGSSSTLKLSQPFATNFGSARQMNSHTVYYFSGSAFVAYDLKTFKTTPLTSTFALPAVVNNIKWSNEGVIFAATGYSVMDQLYKTVVEKSLNPNNYYWWYADFDSDQISLIGDPSTGAGVGNAVWQNDNTIVYSETSAIDDPNRIMRKSFLGTPIKIASIDPYAHLVAATSRNIVFTQTIEDNDALLSLDLQTSKTKQLVKEVLGVLTTGTDGSALLITGRETSDDNGLADEPLGDLVLYSNATGDTKKLATKFSGSAMWRHDSQDWVAVSQVINRPQILTSSNGKLEEYTIPKDASGLVAVGQYQNESLFITNKNELLYGTKNKKGGLPAIQNTSALRNGVYESNFMLAYDENTQEYSAYILSNPYEQTVAATMQYIAGLNIDIYQLNNLRWLAYDNVTTPFQLPANLRPIEEPITINPDEAGE